MNYPNFICYLTPVKGNPEAKFAKCGLDHEVEFLHHLEKMNYQPMVDGVNKPTLSEIQSQKNSIVYKYIPEDKGKHARVTNIIGTPNEQVKDAKDVICIQYYCSDLNSKERQAIADYIIACMDSKPEKNKQILALDKTGCLGVPRMTTCSESNMTFKKTIYPDTKPNPEDFEVVDGKVVEKNK